MSKFITEPGELVPVSEIGPPRTPDQLFYRLGVYCESEAVQREALAEWLRDNEPIPIMRVVLEYDGYVDAEGRLIPAAAA
jgi:hypothetical protein